MTTKTLVFGFLLILSSCSKFNAQKNPDYICKDCGSFDLSKMTFYENISDLTSKTEVWKTAIVNDNNEEKQVEALQKSDVVKFYKFYFSNQQDLILGKNTFNYNNQFLFKYTVAPLMEGKQDGEGAFNYLFYLPKNKTQLEVF
ncbi:hypothetical protein [Epilithonimonas sp.]|uniref:hypothetical protein n=1 Tax=Epilithonimonas sp. TaxID=2894511 RepID=UPI002FDD757D